MILNLFHSQDLYGKPDFGIIAVLLIVVSLTGIITSCGTEELAAPLQTAEEVAMGMLSIDLQEGFDDDLVVVQVNGEEVFRQQDVTTHLMLGHAESFEVETPEGQVIVEVSLPARSLSAAIQLEVADILYLGVYVQDGRIQHRVSEEPFMYF